MRIRTTLMLAAILTAHVYGADLYVAQNGSDANSGTEALPFKTIQKGCDGALPGATVFIKAGTYNERIALNVSGSAEGGFITIRNFGTDAVILDGAGLAAPIGTSAMVSIENKSFIRIQGLEIANYQTAEPKRVVAGIFATGSGSHLELRNNHVHHIQNNAPVNKKKLGRDAFGIAFYGTDGSDSMNHIVVSGNTVDNCRLGSSESLTLNGNVDTFEISGNTVHDNDNIGIVMIGWEGTAPANDQARNGVVRNNIVYNIHSAGNPAYGKESSAAGIYVDGARDIVIERNMSYSNDFGLEVGCEHVKKTASGILIRDNIFHGNTITGMSFGGYDLKRGTTINCQFRNNTLIRNDTSHSGTGEISIQVANGNILENNLVYCGTQNLFVSNEFSAKASFNNTFDYNLYFGPDGAAGSIWGWNKKSHDGFDAYKKASSQDAHSLFADPLLVNPAGQADLHLAPGSPAIDAGNPAFAPAAGEIDLDGNPRVIGARVDIGAYEFQAGALKKN